MRIENVNVLPLNHQLLYVYKFIYSDFSVIVMSKCLCYNIRPTPLLTQCLWVLPIHSMILPLNQSPAFYIINIWAISTCRGQQGHFSFTNYSLSLCLSKTAVWENGQVWGRNTSSILTMTSLSNPSFLSQSIFSSWTNTKNVQALRGRGHPHSMGEWLYTVPSSPELPDWQRSKVKWWRKYRLWSKILESNLHSAKYRLCALQQVTKCVCVPVSSFLK